MAIFHVGPNQLYPTIAAAMAAAGPTDTIELQAGYSNETATVTHSGMTISGEASSTGIVLQLGTGIATFTLAGLAPINVLDSPEGGGIVGNDGNNVITVTDGADAVNGGAGIDRLVVDYHLATTAITGTSTSNFADTGSRLVTINGGFEHFTILTGSGTDTITTGDGDDIINTGEGVSTVTAGAGANIITGGNDSDTITALDGGNIINAGGGTNTVTSGDGNDTITGGIGADTIVAGGGADTITVVGGADTANSGAGDDRLIVNYAAMTTAVTGSVSGTLGAGYAGTFADLAGSSVGFQFTENFTITTGTGNDVITTGDGADVIRTGIGNDVLNTGGGIDLINYTVGDGADTIDAGLQSDTLAIVGTVGNDSINVVFTGGLISGLAGGTVANVELVTLALGAGNDTLDYTGTTAAMTVNLLGAAATGFASISGIENVTGGSGADNLRGDLLVNVLNGMNGNDVMNGLAGNDTLNGMDGNDSLTGGLGIDRLTGGSGNDRLVGGQARDTLVGGIGNDRLVGGNGNDLLVGGLGKDTLLGGAGIDRFDFNLIGESVKGVNRDTIGGFSHAQHDRIDLSTIDANQALAATGNQVFVFIGTDTFANYHATHLNVFGMVRVTGNIVQANVNANMGVDFEIQVNGASSLVAADFIL